MKVFGIMLAGMDLSEKLLAVSRDKAINARHGKS